ncbi:hypothetical protein EWM64_g8078 [Hericium alpestre]|uniref:Uncharacterized protein n=1 Tax=Hericium alpestre TaxID=135208 RepID=A0A4Y9ZNU7_9AGAM|nr:hypothetical protein EWM64_g8078 [Hericium alpestre]
MSYPYPYHFGSHSGTPHTNRRDAVASPQGAVHVNLNIHAQHNYQYTPATNGPGGFYAEHHAGHGAAMQRDHQYYTDSAPDVSYPPLSEEMQSRNAFDPAYNGGMAGYGPPHSSTAGPARSANFYQNIDPVLRRPESSMRSSYSLSDVRDDDWDYESLDDSLDTGRTDVYSPPAIAGRASYAMPHSITRVSESAAVSLQLHRIYLLSVASVPLSPSTLCFPLSIALDSLHRRPPLEQDVGP